MGVPVFSIYLTEDRSPVFDSPLMPNPYTLTPDFFREGQFGAG
jgi:hypothetical protein